MSTLPRFVVLDTCVLISNVLRPVLLRLAAENVFCVAWSPVIADEWCRTAERLWSVPNEVIRAQWLALQSDFPNADQGDVSAYKTGLNTATLKIGMLLQWPALFRSSTQAAQWAS